MLSDIWNFFKKKKRQTRSHCWTHGTFWKMSESRDSTVILSTEWSGSWVEFFILQLPHSWKFCWQEVQLGMHHWKANFTLTIYGPQILPQGTRATFKQKLKVKSKGNRREERRKEGRGKCWPLTSPQRENHMKQLQNPWKNLIPHIYKS